ncbi:MAG TPA: HEAT repeat domain-containing protein [Ktedonobacterales bacterium]|jgi:hypothetical protein
MSLLSGLPNLEYLKNQAKALLKAFRAADPQARQRVEAHLPRFTQSAPTVRNIRNFALADALLVVAREAGFSSWPKLKAHIEAMGQEKPLERETSKPSEDMAAEGKKSAAQRPSVRELARQLADLAMQRDAVGLARRFSRMPLRDILAAREVVVEQGNHSALVETLLEGLLHASPRVRYDCTHTLDHMADDRCAEPLRRLLDDTVPRVRRMALHVLSCDACKLHPLQVEEDIVARVVAHALTDPSINVRRHATTALGNFCADPRVGLALEVLSAKETDPAILRHAYRALRRQKGVSEDRAT